MIKRIYNITKKMDRAIKKEAVETGNSEASIVRSAIIKYFVKGGKNVSKSTND